MAYAMGRVQTLSRLSEDGIINEAKPHHLLGCALPIEFLFYREGFDWIESLDTSNPVVHALRDITYEYGGLVSKQSVKLVDLLHTVPDDEQIAYMDWNIELFRNYVTGE
jgi:hypothetical protein